MHVLLISFSHFPKSPLGLLLPENESLIIFRFSKTLQFVLIIDENVY